MPAPVRNRAAQRRRPAPTLSPRALNRALLARQLLLARARVRPEVALSRLVGLQAQNPPSPYVALWSRLAAFDPDRVSALLLERRAARLPLMRSTLHLVTAEDALRLRALVQPRLDRELAVPGRGRALGGLDRAALARATEEALAAGPLPAEALGAALAARFPRRAPGDLVRAARNAVALVQVPPRGLWGHGGPVRLATAARWLGAPRGKPDAAPLDALLLRYLAAFGPASVADAQAWSGLTGLAPAFARLRPALRVFHDEEGKELLDLPRAPRPEPGTAVPVRFLPDYDNVLLGHAERSRIVSPAHRERRARPNGAAPAAVLVDGFVRAQWRLERAGARATLAVEPLEGLSRAELDEVKEEGLRLCGFLAGDAAVRSVRVDG